MAEKSASNVLRQLRFVVAAWKEDPRTDAELLRRFAQARDEQAFGTLVGRHSELVWGVCLRVLRNPADAEDALQGTFLRLARDAKRIANTEALGGWLFRVARDCSIDLQRALARQRRIEERAAEVARHPDAASSSDLRVLLDDELAQLPRSERDVLVLCCLEGRTYADAALELGCSTAAVHRRFLRAQSRLRKRFARHGSAAAGVLAAVLLGAALPAASAAPPAVLARAVETGVAVAQGAVPATRAGELATATAGINRGGLVLGGLVAATLLVGAALAALAPSPEPQQPPARNPDAPRTAAPADRPHTPLVGVVRGPDGEPVAGATVAALTRHPFGPAERGLRDDLLATATTDAAGRFDLRVPDDFDTWFRGRVVTVQASGAGLAPATCPVRLDAPPAALELKLARAAALRGRLTDADGRPAGGVRVEVVRVGDVVAEPVLGGARHVPPAWPAAATSSADGAFELPALGGSANVWVRVCDPRFALDTFRLDGGPADSFRLAPASPLTVEVRAADTGAPLPGARVTVITDRLAAHPHFCATDHGILGPRSVPADIDAVTDARGRVRVGLAPGDHAEVLVHPPAGAGPYVGTRSRVAAGGAEQTLAVRVPPGRWVTGTVSAGGKPLAGAAVHWGREGAALPEWKDEVLVGRDAIARTAPDGSFRLAVLPGACTVRAYGPTLDYAAAGTRLAGTTATLFAHHVARVEVSAGGPVPPLALALAPAVAVAGTVERTAPDTGAALVLASGRVSPVRGYAALPLPLRGDAFGVPGCRDGYTTRAYLLDPVARAGAVVDVTPGAAAPRAQLRPCGAIRLRVVDAGGEPKPGHDVSLALLVERDRPPASPGAGAADPQPVEWFDATNYPSRPKTGPDGAAELPALIPGARYALALGSGTNKVAVGTFALAPGETLALPDVVLPEGGSR